MSNLENFLESSGNYQLEQSKDYDVGSFNNYNSIFDGNNAQSGGKVENQYGSGFVSDIVEEEKEGIEKEKLNDNIKDKEKEIKENSIKEKSIKKNSEKNSKEISQY